MVKQLTNIVFENGMIEGLKEFSLQSLPIMQSYKLTKLLDEIQAKLTLYQTEKQKLFKKYGEITDDGKQMKIPPTNEEKFLSEFKELTSIKFNIKSEVIDLYGLDEKKYPIALSANTIILIKDFITFEKAVKKNK